MMLLRLTTLVLVLLFLMHAFRAFSSVHAHQGTEIDGDTLESWSQEGIFYDFRTAGSYKIGFEGRKIGAEKELKNEIMEAAGKKSKISGKHNGDSNVFKGFQDQDNNQIDSNKMEPEMTISVDRLDMPKARMMNKRMGGKERLLSVVEKELVNLLHKDYSGMKKPGRKPPINNNEPQH
ncbi:hypothetical protein SLEP1_g10583 [Rubroshorea leprosula]|uniref:Uncharacterized protein n=1 Tax=Rubroshorea leprosula TaxID=152421 RepID=A0AAV5IE99_9ROSI|nr:hypothetical protein SLEP1_g10583 [Rubroshorea leprosula]